MEALRSYKHFCGCDVHNRPINPYNGDLANVRNERNWGFEEDVKSEKKGIMLGNSQYNDPGTLPLVLVKVSGNDEFLEEMSETLDTYCQYGCEYLCQVDEDITLIPKGISHETDVEHDDCKGKIEIIEKDYFMPLLDDNNEKELKNCTTELKFLVDNYYDKSLTVFDTSEEKISDAQALKLACADETFSDIFHGMWQDHTQTKDEAAEYMCSTLAFYTDGNRGQIERLFKQSGVYEDDFDYIKKLISRVCVQHRMCADKYDDTVDTSLAYKMQIASKNALALQKVHRKLLDCDRYGFTDTDNAQRLVDMIGNVLFYDEYAKEWLVYVHQEGRYRKNAGSIVYRGIDDMIRAMDEEIQYYPADKQEAFRDFVRKTKSHRYKVAIFEEVKHWEGITIDEEERKIFDKNDDIFNVINGTIDLPTGKLLPHDPKYMCTNLSPVPYDPNETRKPEKFLGYLEDWIPDPTDRKWLQVTLGMCLTGYISEKCCYFLVGKGNDGKSTLMQIMREIMGTYACNAQPDTFMENKFKNSSGPSSDVARLAGKRFVYAEEATKGHKLNEGLIKQMTGTGELSGRLLRQNETSFKNQMHIWMPTNHKPTIRGTDEAIWDRMRIIEFPHSIQKDKMDRTLVYNLRSEYPLILKWLVDGCVEWYAQYKKTGTPMTKNILKAVKSYRTEMDVIRAFMTQSMEFSDNPNDPDDEKNKIKESIYSLYDTYKEWGCKNHEYVMDRRDFVKEAKAFFTQEGVKWKVSNGNVPYVFGAWVKPNPDEEYDPVFEDE